MSDKTSELLDLVGGVEALAAEEAARAREAYRALLLRLAQDQPKQGDTPATINQLLKDVERSAPEFRADVAEVVELVRIAEEARALSDLRQADCEAAVALREAQEEHERVVKEAETRLDRFVRARDETSRRLYAASDAQRGLLQRLGLDREYERKVDALAAAEASLAGAEGDDEAAAVFLEEAERRRAELWELWRRALALGDHDPFRSGEGADERAGPVRAEGCQWTVVEEDEDDDL